MASKDIMTYITILGGNLSLLLMYDIFSKAVI